MDPKILEYRLAALELAVAKIAVRVGLSAELVDVLRNHYDDLPENLPASATSLLRAVREQGAEPD